VPNGPSRGACEDAAVAHTVLYVPVPELEGYIRWRHEVEGPEWLSPDAGHVHAHITLLGPFLPPRLVTDRVDAQLADLFGAVAPFEVTLAQVRVFPTGLVHLHPEPAGELARLTAALEARFPAYPPYAGEFAPVPHLSLCALGPGRDLATVRAELRGVLPVRTTVREVWLVAYAPHRTRVLRSYRLASTRADT
jgi:2'-5' RNA ligase